MFKVLPFLPTFSSPATSLTTPAASPTLSSGFRPKPCATSLGDGLPGRLVDPIPNTGCEPKFCIDVWSFKQQPAFDSKQGSHFVETRCISDSVVGRSGIKATCADMDRETVARFKGKERSRLKVPWP